MLVSIAGRARAEVWPVSAMQHVDAAFAAVDDDGLSLWSQPGTIGQRPGWRLAAGYLEPYALADLARLDAAVTGGLGSWGVSAGLTRFGQAELSASAWAVGASRSLAGGLARIGGVARRHERERSSSWALDVGVRLTPVPPVAVGVIARSAVRTGSRSVAPEPEWEIGASWRRDPFRLGGSLVRDAVGPISRQLAARLTLGGAWIGIGVEDAIDRELRWRLGVGLGSSRFDLGVARDSRARLPPSSAAIVSWTVVAPGGDEPERGDEREGTDVPEPASAPEPADADTLPPIETELELEADPELIEAEGESALDRWSVEPEVPPRPSPSRWGAPDRSSWVARAHWGATVGLRTTAHRGLASLLWSEFDVRRGPAWNLRGWLAGSRDPGERSGLDELRWTAQLERPDRVALWLGSFDLRIGTGLAVRGPGSASSLAPDGIAVRGAARRSRSRVTGGDGVALEVRAYRSVRVVLWRQHIARDARRLSIGWWPTGGRYHRSETERDRRGRLEERTAGGAVAGSIVGGAWQAGAAYLRAQYPSGRALPGGATVSTGCWLTLFAGRERSGYRAWGEAALGPVGATAARLLLQASGPERTTARLELEQRDRGYAPATAWPASALLQRARLALSFGLPLRSGRVRLQETLDRRWSPPGVTVPARTRWNREDRVWLESRSGAHRLLFEWVRRQRWRLPGPSGSNDAVPTPEPPLWSLHGRWRWRLSPIDGEIGIDGSWTVGVTSRRETWTVSWQRTGRKRLSWRLAVQIRPGATSRTSDPVSLESDPLGGFRFASSSSPSRVRGRLGIPLRGAVEGLAFEGLWSVSSRGPRFELWCTVTGG